MYNGRVFYGTCYGLQICCGKKENGVEKLSVLVLKDTTTTNGDNQLLILPASLRKKRLILFW